MDEDGNNLKYITFKINFSVPAAFIQFNLAMPKTGPVPYRYRVLILLFFLTTLTYLDRVCISIVGVRIKSGLGLSNTQFGWVLASFSLAYAIFEIPSGILGDRIGPKAVFIRIVLLWSLFTAMTGLVNGFIALLLVRFLFGIGESGAFPNSSAVISRWFPLGEMGRAMSWIGTGSHAGSALAPIIIVPLAMAFGWRVPFFVIGALGLVWVLVCFSWFRNFPSEKSSITREELDYIETQRSFSKHVETIAWKSIFKHRTLLALVLMYFCCQWGNYFFTGWLSIYLQEGRHFSENQMKNISSVLFVFGITGTLCGGWAGDWMVRKRGLRFGRRFTGMVGLGVSALLLIVCGFSTQNNVVVFSLFGAELFWAFSVMSSYAVCVDIGRNHAGTVSGMMNFFGQMGAFFLAVIFGKILDLSHSFTAPLYLLSGVLLTGCLLWLAIDPQKKLRLQ
jgi:ACS family glucarate transporter-like MFS transporter